MAVVEGTISAAAKRLHMAQPPLSCQMKSLEEELGTPLFWRGARHITLTPAGQALYKRAQQMQRLSETAKQEVAALRGKVQGHAAHRHGIVLFRAPSAVCACVSCPVSRNTL